MAEGVTKNAEKGPKMTNIGYFCKTAWTCDFKFFSKESLCERISMDGGRIERVEENVLGELDSRKEEYRDFKMRTTNKKHGNRRHGNIWVIWVILKDLGNSDQDSGKNELTLTLNVKY